MRRLIQGLLGAAVAALLGAAHQDVRAPMPGYAAHSGVLGAPRSGLVHLPELRVASERTPKAPPEQAARNRRPSTAAGSGVLPAPTVPVGVSAPAILTIGGSTSVVLLDSECGHCTRAARPPPIS